MAAEYGNVQDQTVEDNQNVLFDNITPCARGLILHGNGSGLFVIKPQVTNPCTKYVRLLALYHANVSIPEGGTPRPISFAISINGEADQTVVATTTPTVAEALFDISLAKLITIPVGCCTQIAVKNITGAAVDVNKPYLIIMPPTN